MSRGKHKGQNGRVLVIGGSEKYVGAPALCALAALRSGVDLVTVAGPEKTAWIINSYSPDLITIKCKGQELGKKHIDRIVELCSKNDVLVIGMGLGRKKEFVTGLVQKVSIPKVIDADALKVITLNVEQAIFTPHTKEFKHLFTNSLEGWSIKMKRNISKVQPHLGESIILLKGETDYIISRKEVLENRTGNDAMTVGGTGDVLAGICAGLVAQGLGLKEAAIKAAEINGRTGDYLRKKYGYWFTASDIIKEMWRFMGGKIIRRTLKN